jgi:Beta/Gamma crystallin
MNSLRLLRTFGYVLALCLVASALPASAQRWEVERAEYGIPGRSIDVTNLVRNWVNSREGRIELNNYTIGNDPAPGQRKVLRIFAAGPNGQRRDFTYRENEFVELGFFREGGGFRTMQRPPEWGRGRRPDAGACFFRDKDFRGDYFCMERGMSYESLPSGFNDRITSIRISGGAEVTIFNDGNFRGVNASTNESVQDLRYWRLPTDPSRSWNDRVSSIQVR